MPQPIPMAVMIGGHGAPPLAAGEDRAGCPGVAPVDVEEEPRHDRHRHEYDDRRGHRPLLERGDGPVAQPGDRDLHGHEEQRDEDLRPVVLRRRVDHPELPQQGHDQVEDDPRVDRAPADGQQRLDRCRHIGAAAAEGGPRQHHAGDPGPLPHEDEQPEDRHADRVAGDEDDQGVAQPEPEVDPQRAEDPVDRRDVRAAPDPELARARSRCGPPRRSVGGPARRRECASRPHQPWRVSLHPEVRGMPSMLRGRRRANNGRYVCPGPRSATICRPITLHDVLELPTWPARSRSCVPDRSRLSRLVRCGCTPASCSTSRRSCAGAS